jgi:hypothetical protein
MTFAPTALKPIRLADPDHPRFVGLAILRSLLAHEEVASQPQRSDAVLDLIALLLRDAPASAVVRAFCRVRRHCAPVCYLAIFRFRRWLEQQIVVKAAAGSWQPLSLAFPDFRRIEQHYRRDAWEAESDPQNWRAVCVDFAWNCSETESLSAGAMAELAQA